MCRMVIRMCLSLAAAIFLSSIPRPAEACNDYVLNIKNLNFTCGVGDSKLQVSKDFGVILTENCIVHPTGCMEYTGPPIKGKARIDYSLFSKMVPLVNDSAVFCELCAKAKEYEDAIMIMNMFGVPASCPYTAGKVCAEGKTVDVSKWKDKFMPGTLQGNIILRDESGTPAACANFDAELISKNPLLGG